MKGFPGFGFNNEQFSDRILHLSNSGKTERIYVNSLTLSQHSDFFKKLFTSGMKESEGRGLQVQVDSDSEATATVEFLKFLYLGELSGTLNHHELLDVLLVGDKFLSQCCVEACLEKLLRLPMSVDVAIQCVVRLPSTDAVSPLKVKAEEFFLQNKITNASDVRGLPVGVFDLLVKKKAIDINKVHDVTMSWADETFTNECDKERALGEVIPYINYGDMSTRELMYIFEASALEEYGYMCVPRLIRGFISKFEKIENLQMHKNFTWKIKNFSYQNRSMSSDVFEAAGSDWKLSAYKHIGYLSLLLEAVADTTLGHVLNVEFSIPKETEEYTHYNSIAYRHKVVDENTRRSGIDQFISLTEIRHDGYLKDDTLTVNLSLSIVRMAKEF